MTGPVHLTMGTRSVSYFSTCAKPLIASHIYHCWTNSKQSTSILTFKSGLVTSYLSDRFQFVTFEGVSSDKLPVVSGVPQGSVLGPLLTSLLFVMYINDVATTISQGSMINMFADDIAYYRIIQSQSDYVIVQKDVDCISSFMSCKLLEFNANKCRVINAAIKEESEFDSIPTNLS